MPISFNTQSVRFTLNKKRKIRSWIKEIVESNKKTVGQVAIIFTSDNYLIEVNKKYLNHDYFTDIITFDYSEKNIIAGDIFISIDTVLINSQKFGTTFNDELLRVIIHGVLHLLGFKDKTDEEITQMRKNEDLALCLFYRNHDE